MPTESCPTVDDFDHPSCEPTDANPQPQYTRPQAKCYKVNYENTDTEPGNIPPAGNWEEIKPGNCKNVSTYYYTDGTKVDDKTPGGPTQFQCSKCVGFLDGQCKQGGQCSPSTYCNVANKCAPYIREGARCDPDLKKDRCHPDFKCGLTGIHDDDFAETTGTCCKEIQRLWFTKEDYWNMKTSVPKEVCVHQREGDFCLPGFPQFADVCKDGSSCVGSSSNEQNPGVCRASSPCDTLGHPGTSPQQCSVPGSPSVSGECRRGAYEKTGALPGALFCYPQTTAADNELHGKCDQGFPDGPSCTCTTDNLYNEKGYDTSKKENYSTVCCPKEKIPVDENAWQPRNHPGRLCVSHEKCKHLAEKYPGRECCPAADNTYMSCCDDLSCATTKLGEYCYTDAQCEPGSKIVGPPCSDDDSLLSAVNLTCKEAVEKFGCDEYIGAACPETCGKCPGTERICARGKFRAQKEDYDKQKTSDPFLRFRYKENFPKVCVPGKLSFYDNDSPVKFKEGDHVWDSERCTQSGLSFVSFLSVDDNSNTSQKTYICCKEGSNCDNYRTPLGYACDKDGDCYQDSSRTTKCTKNTVLPYIYSEHNFCCSDVSWGGYCQKTAEELRKDNKTREKNCAEVGPRCAAYGR